GQEAVGGTGGAGPGAGLRQVAHARRGAARRAGVARRMLADIAAAVASVRGARVAIVGARRAARLERASGRAAGAGRAVGGAVVALLASIDQTVATHGVGDGDPRRVHGCSGTSST